MADNQSTPALHSAGAVRLICKWSMQSYFHNFVLPFGRLTGVGLPKELHPHHGEDEDDDAEDEGEVGERAHRVHHDRQDIVQRLP